MKRIYCKTDCFCPNADVCTVRCKHDRAEQRTTMMTPDLLSRAGKANILVGAFDDGFILCDAQDDRGHDVVFDYDLNYISAIVVMLRGGHMVESFFVAIQDERQAADELEAHLEFLKGGIVKTLIQHVREAFIKSGAPGMLTSAAIFHDSDRGTFFVQLQSGLLKSYTYRVLPDGRVCVTCNWSIAGQRQRKQATSTWRPQ